MEAMSRKTGVSDDSLLSSPSRSSRLWQWLTCQQAAVKREATRVLQEELDRHTVSLDLKYPALLEVREALEERRQAVLKDLTHGNGRDTKVGQKEFFLVLDEKAIQ